MDKYLTWPVTVSIGGVIVVIAALFIFRSAFVRLLDRIKRVSKKGVVFDQEGPQVSATPVLSYESIMNSPVSASVLEREKLIHEQTRKMKAGSEEERTKALIRAMSQQGSDFLKYLVDKKRTFERPG